MPEITGRAQEVLMRKVGPLPIVAWAGIGVIAYIAWRAVSGGPSSDPPTRTIIDAFDPNLAGDGGAGGSGSTPTTPTQPTPTAPVVVGRPPRGVPIVTAIIPRATTTRRLPPTVTAVITQPVTRRSILPPTLAGVTTPTRSVPLSSTLSGRTIGAPTTSAPATTSAPVIPLPRPIGSPTPISNAVTLPLRGR